MDDYLIGAVAAIRSTNPAVFPELAGKFSDDICSGRHNKDRDLMLFARFVLLESDVGSTRAISCALEGKRREDPLLWALLRAWISVGRPDLPDVRAIGTIASDERTNASCFLRQRARNWKRRHSSRAPLPLTILRPPRYRSDALDSNS